MAITTYAELQSAVADWLNRDDLTSVIPSLEKLQKEVEKLKKTKADKNKVA